MKKQLRASIIAAFLAAALLLAVFTACEEESSGGGGDDGIFTIVSPYEGVDWDEWGHYKAALHVHTTNSDGSRSLKEVVDEHYRLGYDIVGITDHIWKRAEGVDLYQNFITYDWTKTEWGHPYTGTAPVPLTYIDQATLDAIQDGSYPVPEPIGASTSLPSVDRQGRGMLMIPKTNEFALSPGEDEFNVFFFEGETAPTAWTRTIRDAAEIASSNNAVFFFNHPGRWTRGIDYTGNPDTVAVLDPVTGAVTSGNPSRNPNFVRRYANLYIEFLARDGLVGMEIFNRRDQDSRNDRILWDGVLTLTAPEGRMVWGYGNDDSHNHTGIFYNYNVMVMPENTAENFRSAMTAGQSYIVTTTAFNEGVTGTNTDTAARPIINSVVVDHEAYTITITATNATRIQWISEGRQIAVTQGASGTLRLAHIDFIDEIGSYVRANIYGEGGMAVIQPIRTQKN